jgi:hypothetical protein
VRPAGVPSTLKGFCEWLGDDPDEIAYVLATLGCDGQRRERGRKTVGPLAIAIERYVITWTWSRVSDHSVMFGDPQIIDYTLPEPVRQFSENFNDGKYPFLVSSQPS